MKTTPKSSKSKTLTDANDNDISRENSSNDAKKQVKPADNIESM